MSEPALLHELRTRVRNLTTDPGALSAAATDRSGLTPTGAPAAVVRATSVEDVQETLRVAGSHGVPVVPRGAGSGLAGGALAPQGAIVLDLTGLDRILAIDAEDGYAVVEAGVITADLDAAAAAHGLRYAPDPASAAISTIGGNIATNAGGLRCVKYGVTRDAVLGLDVVLADGTLVHTGRRTAKSSAGLDLTSLFVGSEGTLGVVVGATLRLRPRPAVTLTAAAGFDDVATAARACAAISADRREPSMLELLDRRTLDVIDRAQGTDYARRGGAIVIAQADGPGAAEEIAAIHDLLAKESTWAEQAVDAQSSERLVAIRRLALPSIETFGRALIEDICVPRSRLVEAFAGVEAIAQRHGVDIYSFAHAGDGNLHPLVSYPAGDGSVPENPVPENPVPENPVPENVVAAGDDIFALALDLGGTVSGEHGIGVLKRAWLAREIGPDGLALHHALKAALDPRGVLNPGKAY